MDTRVEAKVNVLTLPWVVGSDNSLALTTFPPQSLSSPRISFLAEVPDLQVSDPKLRDLLERHTGDFSYKGVEVEPLCATHAGQVVARARRGEDLDVVATVGHVRGSPADPDSSGLRRLIDAIQPQEERILRQEVDWDRGLRQTGSSDLDSLGAARRVTERTLEEYDKKSNLGSVLSSLGEEENFEPVANPPRKVRVMAEKGIVPALYQEMEEYARPEVVGYSVATGDPNIWRAAIVADPAIATIPKDPPVVFPLDGHRAGQWGQFVPGYEQAITRGVRLLTARPRNLFTGEHDLRRNIPLSELTSAARDLDPDRQGSGANLLLTGGVPTSIAKEVIASTREPFLKAAEMSLLNTHFRSHEAFIARLLWGLEGLW